MKKNHAREDIHCGQKRKKKKKKKKKKENRRKLGGRLVKYILHFSLRARDTRFFVLEMYLSVLLDLLNQVHSRCHGLGMDSKVAVRRATRLSRNNRATLVMPQSRRGRVLRRATTRFCQVAILFLLEWCSRREWPNAEKLSLCSINMY